VTIDTELARIVDAFTRLARTAREGEQQERFGGSAAGVLQGLASSLARLPGSPFLPQSAGFSSATAARSLGLSGLLTGVLQLFGGRRGREVVEFEPLARPSPLHFEGLLESGAGQIVRMDRDLAGAPRAMAAPAVQAAAPQVVVQVNAMDSRSFLDHSSEIASAVRQAMLTSHPINDVLGEV
jgi:hypothetical protein